MKRLTSVLVAALFLLNVGIVSAFPSGDKPAGTGPNTIEWTGQGQSGGVLNDEECPSNDTLPGDLNEDSYLHWIMTADGGTGAADDAILHLGSTEGANDLGDYPVTSINGQAYHFFTPYYDPADLFAYVSMDITNTGTAPWGLKISHGCAGGGEEADNLTVTKTAVPSYTRTFDWTIDKTADTDTVYSAGGDESGAVEWTIEVTKDTGTDSAWAISGTISVTNTGTTDINDVDLSDSTPDGDCTLDDNTVDVPAGATVEVDYTCTFESNPGDGTNTARATASDESFVEGTADFDFANAEPTLVNDEIDVTDDNSPDSPYHFTESGSVSYQQTFTDPEGTCTEHDNTATIDQTGATSSDTTQDCQGADLIVTKTAEASFDRSYDWDIDKDVDNSYIELLPGDDHATFNYTVTLSHDAGTDSNWSVSGVITVENPNDWQDVTLDSLTDSIDNGGDCTLDEVGPYVVPMADEGGNGELEVGYTCVYDDAPTSADFTNTATATWDAATYNTPTGSDDGTAESSFDEPTNVTDDCVSVSDELDADSPREFCVGDVELSFTYSNNVPNPGLGHCVQIDNTASFTSNDGGDSGEDSESVDVCTYNASLTIGYWKTHMHQCAARERQATGGCSSNGPFTGQYLPQTLGSYSVNTEAKALAIFNGNNCSNLTAGSNALACLAAQLLGTKLNIANGSNPSCISATIAAADAFLISKSYVGPTGTYTLTAAQRATAISLKTALDNYNNNGC